MRLRTLARLAVACHEATKKVADGDTQGAGAHVVRHGLPAVADALFGQGAGTLLTVGRELVQSRGILAGLGAVDAEYRTLTPGQCTLCGPQYRPVKEAALVKRVAAMPSGICYVLGRRGTGKTALSMRLAELWDRPTYVMGVPQRQLPAGWRELRPPTSLKAHRKTRQPSALEHDLTRILGTRVDLAAEDDDDTSDPFLDWLEAKLPQGSALLVDDAGLVLDSATSGSAANRMMKYLVMIVRHREVNLVINTQYAAAVSKYVLDADLLLLKPPPRWWNVIEREEFKALYTELDPWWQTLPESAWKAHAWAVSDSPRYSGPVHVSLPSFWSEQLSRNKAGR